jgi:signal transduction histidine kinase
MFTRARIRLTILYVVLFTVVLGAFSVVFYVGFANALAPTFDLAPELTNEQAAELAYQATVDRVRFALIVADVIVVGVVAVAAWILASRTLRPIGEAQARQRRFVADASHEMRTPLAAIKATAERAMSTDERPADVSRALGVIVESADRLSRMTADLLLLARAGELPAERHGTTMDLSVVVAEAVEAFAVAHPKVPRAKPALAPDLPVIADPDEIGRIVANLLDNAYRYGGAASPPRIVTRRADREVLLEVRDEGPGIAETDLERIFEPFARLRADADQPEGSGLGLAIARDLAHRNGGRLTVSSRLAEGATFRLYLPRFR